ncbi:MAG: zinc-binding dehydrogenase, partial [Baekduia sp.]
NFGDLLVREGSYMGRDALPVIPGWEVAGRRADTGERVVALLSGNGYAERVAAPAADVVPVPEDVPDAVALAMVIQGATAWHLLEVPQPFTAGEAVLITGAGSGVTHLVVQLAQLREPGAVIVCASDDAKAERVLELGADMALHTDELDGQLTEAARAAAGPGGADLLIDCVGEPLFGQLMRALRPGGRAVVYGVAGGTPAQVHTGALLKHGLTVSGLWLGHGGGEPLATTLERLFGFWRDGVLTPTLGPELPLDQAAEAHRLVAARTGAGKVVLRV